jgi:tetratricopeptide (TPR) repeat protein
LSTPSPSPDLIEALNNGRAIAIVGSGLSSQVGGPRWEDLLYGMLAEACETRPEETDRIKAAFQEIKENRLLSAAGLLKAVLGAGFAKAVVRQIEFKRELLPRKDIKETKYIRDALFETCGQPEKRNLVPSINHRILMQLPFRAIITTNYDRLLEQASPAEKINSVFTRSYPYLPKRVVERNWFLLKVHGSVDTPEDIILSRDDYQEALFGEPLREVLESLFKTNEKFWIGYGHNDPTLDFLVDECREKLHLNGGFAIAKKTNYALQRRFETACIQPSWVDDHSQISDYLRKLAEATNSPLIFEITIRCEWTGERDAESYGKRIAGDFSKFGGDFELFRVEKGSIRLYLETSAPTLAEFRTRLIGGDVEILKVIKHFKIVSFDGLNIDDLSLDETRDEIILDESKPNDVFECRNMFSIPHQIPPPPNNFKGREDEIRDIFSNFEKGATITGLRGMGGVGKTALALVLADKLKSQFPDGQIFIEMRGTSTNPDIPPLKPEEAMAQVIRAYNPVDRLPENSIELRGLYLKILTGKRVLLLLDNAANSEQVYPLLPPDGCSVLITSRIKFDLWGLVKNDLDILPPDKAQELLLGIAPRIGNRAENLAEICGYLPIALKNAASALAEKKDLSVSDYERRLKDKVARLELAEASFSTSYDLLTTGRKKQWRRLSVFLVDFDRDAATAVLKMATDASAEALSDLVRWSLMDFTTVPDSKEGRYKLHDLARLFAESCLDQEELADAQQKHAKHYSKVLLQAQKLYGKGGTNLLAGLKLFDREWANIKIGQAWVKNIIQISKKVKRSDLKQVMPLARSYAGDGIHVLDLRLHPRDKISWFETGLTASRMMADQGAEGVHLGNLGSAYADLGEIRKAIFYHEQALNIFRKICNRSGEGVQLGNLGNRYAGLGEIRKAIEYHEQALSISREIGERMNEGVWLGNLGNRYADLGETRKATEYYDQALNISREIGDKRGEEVWLGSLGIRYADLGETRKAIEYHEQALAISREIGDRRGEGADLGNLGMAYAGLGETRKAIEYHEQALAISREIGDRRSEGADLGCLGIRYADLGETRKAIEYHEQALSIAREIGDKGREGAYLGNLGMAYAVMSETRKSIKYYEQALAIAREIGDKQNEGEFLCNLGKAYLYLNEANRAIEYCMQSLDIVCRIEYKMIEGEALCTLGKAYSDLGEIDKALDHCDRALNIFEKMEYRRGEGDALFNKSQSLHKLGLRPQAFDRATQALQIFVQIESPQAEKVRQKLAEWVARAEEN